MLKTSLTITLALVIAASLAPVAGAASPPKGNYGCKKKGSYSTKGKRITFKTGDYKTIYFGTWSKVKNVLDSGYSYKVDLYGKKDGKQKLTCTKSRG